MTTECGVFEVEIGMRHHGALDSKEEAGLDTHLSTCASCRAFARSGDDIVEALQRSTSAEVKEVDWNKLHEGARRLRASYVRKLWLAPLFVLQAPLIFLLGVGHAPPAALLAAAPATVGLYLGYVWLVNLPFREVMKVAKAGDDLLRGYVRELQRQQLRARIFVAANLLFTAVSLGSALLIDQGMRLRLYLLGCALVFGAWAAYDLRSKLPRLRRALAENGR